MNICSIASPVLMHLCPIMYNNCYFHSCYLWECTFRINSKGEHNQAINIYIQSRVTYWIYSLRQLRVYLINVSSESLNSLSSLNEENYANSKNISWTILEYSIDWRAIAAPENPEISPKHPKYTFSSIWLISSWNLYENLTNYNFCRLEALQSLLRA